MSNRPPVSVRKVETPQELKAFLNFPWTVFKDDPNWAPPLVSMRHELFDKQKHPAWDYIEGDYYAAWRGDQIVGTIVPFINKRHNEFWNENIAWFGGFDVLEDDEAAKALFDTAIAWARERGVEKIRGPQTFTTHDETGLLVDGFERQIILMPYNKPYYERMVLAQGFQPSMDTYSFYLGSADVAKNGLNERLERITQSIIKRNKISVRPVDRKNMKKEFELFKELYNAAWDKNWGFVPMTPRELDGLVTSIGQFFDPDLAYYAYVGDDPAGFILGIPDFNQILHKIRPRPGKPEIISLLQALYYWKIKKSITWARVPLMGVKEEYRNKGVDVVMYSHLLNSVLNKNYAHSDSGWILSTNESMVSIALNFGSRIYRTYRYYDYQL